MSQPCVATKVQQLVTNYGKAILEPGSVYSMFGLVEAVEGDALATAEQIMAALQLESIAPDPGTATFFEVINASPAARVLHGSSKGLFGPDDLQVHIFDLVKVSADSGLVTLQKRHGPCTCLSLRRWASSTKFTAVVQTLHR